MLPGLSANLRCAPGFKPECQIILLIDILQVRFQVFVANSLPGSVLVMFTWNPLFHVIDQARGFAFINYQPRNSDPLYPLYFSLGLLMIGFIGEYYTRQRVSSSWLAKI